VIRTAVERDHFFTIWLREGERETLIAASAAYLLADGIPIRIDASEASSAKHVTWEIGSSLRRRERELHSANGALPRNLYDLMKAALVIDLFNRANDIQVDALTVNIQVVLGNLDRRITSMPHCWTRIDNPHTDLAEALSTTTSEPNQAIPKRFYRHNLTDLPSLATYLLALFHRASSEAAAYPIDLTVLGKRLRPCALSVAQNCDFFWQPRAIDLSLSEARRSFSIT
jgi:hypothetical protein